MTQPDRDRSEPPEDRAQPHDWWRRLLLQPPEQAPPFCGLCGLPVVSFDKVLQRSFDPQTGDERTRTQRVWACQLLIDNPFSIISNRMHYGTSRNPYRMDLW